MTDMLVAQPTPVVNWDAAEHDWLAARTGGIGGSDIAAVLGFSGYVTPWEVWADKTGARHRKSGTTEATRLGHELEPWLLAQAPALIGMPVEQTAARTYAHPQYPWRMYSPDGVVVDGRLAEFKTGGLTSYGTPSGWDDDSVPLGYEFQVRWGLHVMDAPAAEVVALIAGLGLIRRTITRDLGIEADLVTQVTEWHQRHIVEGVEPPLGAGDGAAIAALYPRASVAEVDLDDTDITDLCAAYREALARETAAKGDKERHGAAIKALLGTAAKGRVLGRVVATWSEKRGAVDYARLIADLTAAGVTVPDLDQYRKPATRSLSVKD